MIVREHVALAPLTTLGVGGKARFFIEAENEKDIRDAVAFARERGIPMVTLGFGSNVLVPDTDMDVAVIQLKSAEITLAEEGEHFTLSAGAGASWDDVVDVVAARGIFGLENLAGIPGSVGGAAVQNIGAYGAELAPLFAYADTVHRDAAEPRCIVHADAAFAYRSSYFKQHPEYIITRVVLHLSKKGTANLSYADLARAHSSGVSLTNPVEIAHAVRAIRAKKFPQMPGEGTAGSFFKNPIVSHEHARLLRERFPEVPLFPQPNGAQKIPLAWILDRALSLKGYTKGAVRLYEEQPLVLVARAGATAAAIDSFAQDVAEQVFHKTGITIEREVETFGMRST